MPRTKKYTSVKRTFTGRYGKKRGASVFYATMNSRRRMRKALTGSTKFIGGRRKRH